MAAIYATVCSSSSNSDSCRNCCSHHRARTGGARRFDAPQLCRRRARPVLATIHGGCESSSSAPSSSAAATGLVDHRTIISSGSSRLIMQRAEVGCGAFVYSSAVRRGRQPRHARTCGTHHIGGRVLDWQECARDRPPAQSAAKLTQHRTVTELPHSKAPTFQHSVPAVLLGNGPGTASARAQGLSWVVLCTAGRVRPSVMASRGVIPCVWFCLLVDNKML
eukprot:COSAG06_NODE_8720_length_2089_cov_1.405025_5_plen_221_part_00